MMPKIVKVLLNPIRGFLGPVAAWLPWLVVALLVVGILWPDTITASRLVYQDSPPPTQPTMLAPVQTETPTPPPPATNTPVPMSTDTPVQPPPATDTPAAGPPAADATPAPEGQPSATPPLVTGETPTLVPIQPIASPTPLSSGVRIPTAESPQLMVTPEMPAPGKGMPIINWTKFWDSVVVAFAYPWLCCGILLLLIVPLGMLYLEIKGRRRPPSTPESLPERLPELSEESPPEMDEPEDT
jgi:hypothetical protein